jgi:hypothetical protein
MLDRLQTLHVGAADHCADELQLVQERDCCGHRTGAEQKSCTSAECEREHMLSLRMNERRGHWRSVGVRRWR